MQNSVASLTDLREKVNDSGKETMPINWINAFDSDINEFIFHLLRISEHLTSIVSSVIVDNQLNIKEFFEKQNITYFDSFYRRVQSLLSENKVKSFVEICNVPSTDQKFS